MGCHTWFYKKVEMPPYEEIKKVVIQIYKKNISELSEWIDNPLSGQYLNLLKSYPEWTIEYTTKLRDTEARRLRMVENNLCKVAVINKYCLYSAEIMEYVNGNIYADLDDYHDLFRKYGYPEDRLFSLNETLDYINNPANECITHENTVENLTEFWTKYPDGMITFG